MLRPLPRQPAQSLALLPLRPRSITPGESILFSHLMRPSRLGSHSINQEIRFLSRALGTGGGWTFSECIARRAVRSSARPEAGSSTRTSFESGSGIKTAMFHKALSALPGLGTRCVGDDDQIGAGKYEVALAWKRHRLCRFSFQ